MAKTEPTETKHDSRLESPDAPVFQDPGPFNPEKPSVLLEDGREISVAKGSFSNPDGHDFRVHDSASNSDYEHTATRADGRWLYRPMKG